MTYSPSNYTGDGSTTDFSFSWDSVVQSDNKVSINGTVQTSGYSIINYTAPNGGTFRFSTAPEVGDEIKVFRDTDIDPLKVTFASASAIRAVDLNTNFEQLQNAIEENYAEININDSDLSALEDRVKQNEADIAQNASDIADNAAAIALNASKIATNAANISTNAANIASNTARITKNESDIAANTANFANYWRKQTETIESNEAWSNTNSSVATTAAIDARITSQITAAYPTQTFSTNTTTGTLTLQPGGDTTTVTAATTSKAGLLTAADKQKLDRIQFNTRRNTTFTTSFNGTSTDYTLTHKTPNSAFEILLTVGGIIQQPNVDFTYNPDTGVVSFTKAPPKTAPYGITFNSVLTSDVGQVSGFENFLSEEQIQHKLDLAATAVDAMFDQLRVAIDEATDFDTLKARLLAVLQ